MKGIQVPKIVFLVGPPGCGKGIQAKRLAQDFGYTRVSLGDAFREEIKKGTLLGDRVKTHVEQKKLVADELIVEILHKMILEKKGRHILLEGFPRTLSQAVTFEGIVGECSVVLNLTAKDEVLVERLERKGAEIGASGYTKPEIQKRIDDYMAKAQPAIDYYTRLGKVRTVDCSGSISGVYSVLLRNALPHVYFVIGPKGSGKSTVCDYLSSVTGLKQINFADWSGKKFNGVPTEPILREFIKELHAEPNMKVAVEGFPRNMSELQYLLSNGVDPSKVIYINATEGRCMKSAAPTLICQQYKEFHKQSKDLITLCKKKDLLYEICNTEDTLLKTLLDSSLEVLSPELILARSQHENGQLEVMLRELTEKGYLHIDTTYMEQQEIVRKTQTGLKISQLRENGQKIPPEVTIELLRKFVYPVSGAKKVILTGFPNDVRELSVFEGKCGKISKEFFFFSSEYNSNISESTLETHMQFRGKLVAIEKFNSDLMDLYRGVDLQYVLIAGPIVSGKTVAAKKIEKFGFTLIDFEGIAEDIKKRLATEENPAETINVTFEQKLEELIARTVNRKNINEKFVLDGLQFEDLTSIMKIVAALGQPSYYIELVCDAKEIKKRFMKKTEVAELNEEEAAKFDKQIETYQKVEAMLNSTLIGENVKHYTINTEGPEDSLVDSISNIFEPKLVLVKHDKDLNVDPILTNLSIKHSFLYVSVPDLIRNEIEQKTQLGLELVRTQKMKELLDEFAVLEDSKYCAVHYEQKLVVQVLKERIKRSMGKYQTVIINGYLNSHKLKGWEEKQEFRAMDELFELEKVVGKIKGILNFTKEFFEEVEDDRVPEKVDPKPQQKDKVDDKPKEDAGEPQDNKEEVKVQFKPEDYMWTNTAGKPRTLGQFYTGWKNCPCKNFKSSELSPETYTKGTAIDSLIQDITKGEMLKTAAFIQVKFSS